MTTEEAIKIFQVAKAEIEWSAQLDYQEAIDMAVKALEKQKEEIHVWDEVTSKYGDGEECASMAYLPQMTVAEWLDEILALVDESEK